MYFLIQDCMRGVIDVLRSFPEAKREGKLRKMSMEPLERNR